MRRGVTKQCPVCGVCVYFRPSHSKRVFCNKKCADIAKQTGKNYTCTVCGKSYYRNNGQIKHRGETKYCSKPCKGVIMKKLAISQMSKVQKIKTPKNVSTLKKNLWKEFATYIKRRDKNICFTCDTYCEGYNAHAGHFISKAVGGLALYFNEKNVHCQCMRCNIHLSGNQYEYGLRLGEDVVKELQLLKQKTEKWTAQEYLNKIAYYKELNA